MKSNVVCHWFSFTISSLLNEASFVGTRVSLFTFTSKLYLDILFSSSLLDLLEFTFDFSYSWNFFPTLKKIIFCPCQESAFLCSFYLIACCPRPPQGSLSSCFLNITLKGEPDYQCLLSGPPFQCFRLFPT